MHDGSDSARALQRFRPSAPDLPAWWWRRRQAEPDVIARSADGGGLDAWSRAASRTVGTGHDRLLGDADRALTTARRRGVRRVAACE